MKRLVQALWVLPVAAPIYLFYLWPFQLIGLLRRRSVVDEVIYYVPRFPANALGRLWLCAWSGWWGHAMPGAIVLRPDAPRRSVVHELEHVRQWYRWGVLFPFVYLTCTLLVGYRDNPFEVAARAAEYK